MGTVWNKTSTEGVYEGKDRKGHVYRGLFIERTLNIVE